MKNVLYKDETPAYSRIYRILTKEQVDFLNKVNDKKLKENLSF